METELVPGKAIPKSDVVLSLVLGLPDAATVSDKSILRFGIENADGDVYRIVGFSDPLVFVDLFDLLPLFRYDIEVVNSTTHNGLRALIKKQI